MFINLNALIYLMNMVNINQLTMLIRVNGTPSLTKPVKVKTGGGVPSRFLSRFDCHRL